MLSAVSILALTTFFSQNPGPILTDRPWVSDRPSTVPAGHLQAELGGEFGRERPFVLGDSGLRAGLTSWTTPAAVRYGLLDSLELRVRSQGFRYVRVDSELRDFTPDGEAITRDFSGLEIGSKVAFGGSERFQIGASLDVFLPIGTELLGSNDYVIRAALLARAELAWGAHLILNLGTNLVFDRADRIVASDSIAVEQDDTTLWVIPASIALLVPLGEDWTLFGELFGNLLRQTEGFADDERDLSAGAGLAWRPWTALLLDVSGRYGIDFNDTDLVVGIGVSYLF